MLSNHGMDIVRRKEDIFRKFHGHSLNLKKNPIDRLFSLLAREIHSLDILKLYRAENFEWDILNPDQLINLEINNKRRTSII